MPSLAERAEATFRLLIHDLRDFSIFLLDPDGRIETWNAGAEQSFGWTAEEAVGQPFDILFVEEDLREGRPRLELEIARAAGRCEDTRWHRRKDGRLLFADGVTTAVKDDGGTIVGFSKISRDITERYRTEQRLAAQLALTNILNGQEPLSETARHVMKTICENLGWDLGTLWLVDEQAGILRCTDFWAGANSDVEISRELCSGQTMQRGEGLPGRVWESAQPVWIPEFRGDEFRRSPLAARAGMIGAFAFPITHEGHVNGVLEFFSRRHREPDQALLPVMALIGAQIGDYIARRRTAVALRESEERYRVVSETAQDAIFTIDSNSNILFCNRAVERLFGWKPEELVGRNLEIIIPESLRPSHHRGIERFLRTGEKHIPWNGVELPALHKSGREVPVEISFGVWREGGRTIFTGFARDITERQRARAELQQTLELEQQARSEAESARGQLERRAEEEESFRHLASALTGAVEMTEVLYEITNRATLVTRADGVYVERIIADDGEVEVVSAFGRGTPARGTRVPFPGSMTEEIIKGRMPVILTDMQRLGKAMAPYLVESCPQCQVLVTPLIADNEPLGALVLLNSRQSGRTFGDADMIRARTLGDLASLALRRVRLMEEEREAREAAETAVQVRDETLGIVSHDLRNPLTKIALSADLLPEADAEERGELIATIRLAASQATRLIQDLLDVARVEAGAFSVEMKPLSASWLVASACESHEPLAAQKRQKILCSAPADLPEICADRDRMLQVFGNLIGNAMKFTPEGGAIHVSASPRGNDVLFMVRDSGPGMPLSDLRNVFRPYWQAKKTAHMGAGLGLAIVRGIIEAHGGAVWADNAPGGGAQFSF
ncbi:MAG: Sensory box histidine kinase, partial [Acidobacteria bacterium]|nr:Sensory box histidine kinase [Acidobacteriota bacterium]